jgi:large subunit ribosomal protein L2
MSSIKYHKPTTSARRGMTTQDFTAITSKRPIRSLVVAKKRGSGRNNAGRITTRHQGGGVKRHYRVVNFKLDPGITATVEQIEYDPGRAARIARIKESNGKYHYILAAKDMKIGQTIKSDSGASIETGNRLPLKNIPVGSTIHAIELKPGRGAQMVRSAGNSAQLMARENGYAQVRLPSGEVRQIKEDCQASIGAIGNDQHQNVKIGKAGRNRHLGKRPTVRGVVMNAVDHPHGGGDGGRHRMAKAPRTPWGQKTLGYKTRSRKSTTKYIVRSRHQGKRK